MNDVMQGLEILGFIAGLYMLPFIVAAVRSHHQTLAIFVLNLLAGWTFIGWLVAIVWACTAVKKDKDQLGVMAENRVMPPGAVSAFREEMGLTTRELSALVGASRTALLTWDRWRPPVYCLCLCGYTSRGEAL